MTLPAIVTTWEQFRRADLSTQQLVLKRSAICDTCPNKRQLTQMGSIQQLSNNLPGSVYYCGSCGCSLWRKLKDPDNNCPISKWIAE